MEKVSLTDLLGGAAVEAFDYEIGKVAENILDPNTPPLAVREITLKVKIKPSPERDMGSVTVACTSKLAPSAPLASRMYFGMQGGKPIAVERNPNQPNLPGTEQPTKLRAIGGQSE